MKKRVANIALETIFVIAKTVQVHFRALLK